MDTDNRPLLRCHAWRHSNVQGCACPMVETLPCTMQPSMPRQMRPHGSRRRTVQQSRGEEPVHEIRVHHPPDRRRCVESKWSSGTGTPNNCGHNESFPHWCRLVTKVLAMCFLSLVTRKECNANSKFQLCLPHHCCDRET